MKVAARLCWGRDSVGQFGQKLKDSMDSQWRQHYLNYDRLKSLIKALSPVVHSASPGERISSLTMQGVNEPCAPFEGGTVTEADFIRMIEAEMQKVDAFTQEQVGQLKGRVDELEREVDDHIQSSGGDSPDAAARASLKQLAVWRRARWLKFVNYNFTGFHKILKKHDKHMPTPLRMVYAVKMREQSWISGDYSSIFVRLSHLLSRIRGDGSGTQQQDGAQQFVRKTIKYWVPTEHITRIKYMVMRELPVFQMTELPGDSQLCNSVYLDNESMELYRGRLNKTAGAIAIRLRWYNTASPQEVFVERKTHRDTWTGEESVKERFSLDAKNVYPFLIGAYTLEDAQRDARSKGLSDFEVDSMTQLFKEIYAQIDSKQLVPCVRTQYMRAAYQIPFDATVRISLDTHLAMINENPVEGVSTMEQGRWFRDPMLPTPPSEITHFPHAVLEVKLSLQDGEEPPSWVNQMVQSGMVTEVHKFSKFLHGCCTLLPQKVDDVPYWVDDSSVRPSIEHSQMDMNRGSVGSQSQGFVMQDASQPGAKAGTFREPLLGVGSGPEILNYQAPEGCDVCAVFPWGGHAAERARKVPMKVEPKVFFANERTFLSWLHISVTLGSVGAVLLGFSHDSHDDSKGKKVVGICLCFVGVLFALYALATFYWRARKIRLRLDGPFDDRVGPMLMCVTLVGLLCALAGWYIHQEFV